MRLLTASEFEHASEYVRMKEENRQLAFKHLVLGLPMSQIAREQQCSRQNIRQFAERMLAGLENYEKAQERLSQ